MIRHGSWLMGFPMNYLQGCGTNSYEMELMQEIERYLDTPKGFLTELIK